jgi:DNA-(apurinic or apyrimidinic site) lyase
MILNLVNNKLKLAKGQSLQEKLDFFERNYDFQFYSIKKIINKYPDKKAQILFGIIQNALISYQLSGTGERWREEFSNFMIDNLDTFLTDNCLFWKRFLSVCKNNRRFINNKLKRIQKIADVKQFIENRRKLLYQNMIELNNLLAQIMGQTINAKTIVFAVKMF